MAASTPDHPARPGAVIHDLGYRPHTGARQRLPEIFRTLYLLGVRHAFGLGRSARSKVLPFVLLAAMVGPALLLVAVPLIARQYIAEFPKIVEYHDYQENAQVLSALFVAAQAPVLMSRDIRFGTLPLYLARPLPPVAFVLARLASLVTAVAVLVGVPVLVLYAGYLLGDFPLRQETEDVVPALVGVVLLSLLLGVLGGWLASVTPRRGLGTVVIVAVLLVAPAFVAVAQEIGRSVHREALALGAGLLSPYTLVAGATGWWFDRPAPYGRPDDAVWGSIYTVVLLAAIVGLTLLTVGRFRRRGARS